MKQTGIKQDILEKITNVVIMKENRFKTVEVSVKDMVCRVALNRPDVRNAFDDRMIDELTFVFREISRDKSIRVVVLTGNGQVFCAGADLNWMKKMKSYTEEENLADSMALARMLQELYFLPKPTIARVNGDVFGGGNGLVCACDIAVSVDSAIFSFSEVKLGLTPAVISPFVVNKLGDPVCRDLFLTGRKFSAQEALSFKMVHATVTLETLDQHVGNYTEQFLANGPEAISASKKLLERLSCKNPLDYAEYTSKVIARLRVSAEGQEGIRAFFEKRSPSWKKKLH